MASTKLMTTKDGKRFFQISVSRGYGKAPYKKRWYWPDGWSKRTAERELKKVAAEFERACAAGEIKNRTEQKEIAAAAAAERAKLKTFRDYALGVYMASKEQSFSENARSSYMMFLEKHIFPAFGDMLLVEISTAMINKFLLDFQKQGYKQATVTKLYNIMNGVFTMAFMDDSIPINPMIKANKPKVSKEEKAQATRTNDGLSFGQIFTQKSIEENGLKFSKHASFRLNDRGIEMTQSQVSRLNEGARKAAEKGIKDSLVLVDDMAFIVNIPNQTVVTAMDSTETIENVFTHINGAVIM